MTTLRIATYNIHKGVQGLGPVRRLEIHNLGHAVEQLDADVVCLQEVRKVHRREERYFTQWPELPQAEFLCPEGYFAVYQTNARTRHGELADWGLENVYDIYPHYLHRYAPGVLRNREHVFGLCVPAGTPVALNPREHTAWQWLPWRQAADTCFSPSNAEAILMLTQFAA